MIDLALRGYAASDLPAVRALHKASFAALAKADHAPAQIAAHLALIDGDAYAEDVERSHLILAQDAVGLAATAGWLRLDDEPTTARIRKVFVRPDLARQGIGRRMVEAAETYANANGCERFFVRANINAVPLYRALGYRLVEDGAMPVGNGLALPVAFMRKG